MCLDDDNEIDSNYLIGLQELIQMHPHVWAWGPGKITVEYETKIPDWLVLYSWLFQEKNQDEVLFDNTKFWNIKYPSGTGLAIKKEVAQKYLENVKQNKMTATCRNGGGLTSGGDSQIVYCAIQLGKYAGTAPQLIINHLTEQKKDLFSLLQTVSFWGFFLCGISC